MELVSKFTVLYNCNVMKKKVAISQLQLRRIPVTVTIRMLHDKEMASDYYVVCVIMAWSSYELSGALGIASG